MKFSRFEECRIRHVTRVTAMHEIEAQGLTAAFGRSGTLVTHRSFKMPHEDFATDVEERAKERSSSRKASLANPRTVLPSIRMSVEQCAAVLSSEDTCI